MFRIPNDSHLQTYFYNDDTFNFNFGQALAFAANYTDAESTLSLVKDENILRHFTYKSTIARCCKIAIRRRVFIRFVDIMNKKSRNAWDLYTKMDTSSDSFSLLQLIANDCYKVYDNWYVYLID
jgi:intraflagellar transport protein 56